MEKLTNLAQLRSSSLEARRLAAQVVEAASKDMETLAGSFLPRDGSGAMTGALKLGNNGIFFGAWDVYLGDGNVTPEYEQEDISEAVEDVTGGEAEEPRMEEDEVTGGETEEAETEEDEVSGAESTDHQKIEFMQLCSAASGGYVPLSVGAPVRTTDAATKGYVDGLIGDIASILDEINGEVA